MILGAANRFRAIHKSKVTFFFYFYYYFLLHREAPYASNVAGVSIYCQHCPWSDWSVLDDDGAEAGMAVRVEPGVC